VSSVKQPLRLITSKEYEIASFARHLRELSEPARCRILHRVGETYRLRYRISNPILRPYVIMRGIKDKIISKSLLDGIKVS
jgi:hypothetical protein